MAIKTEKNIRINSKEKSPAVEVKINNQNVRPEDTIRDLNRGDDMSILYWVNESNQSGLS